MANIPQGYYGIEFPEYKFEPYPAWVTDAAGKKVLVQNAHEERLVKEVTGGTSYLAQNRPPPQHASGLMKAEQPPAIGGTQPMPEAPLEDRKYLSKDDMKADLIVECEKRGIRVDKRWKLERIQELLS